ncbi:MAG: aldo/keto reductase, partial [Candidatus Poribacteria bacterium]|nr:aldo/keto reductase [Candidatus Poribacteria bacterium]
PVMDKDEAALALRFTLSQPITAAIPPGDANLFRWAMDIAENFQPLTETELEEVKKRSEGLQPIFELAA